MTDASTRSVTMAAPADRIMDAIADFEAYPEWAEAITSVEVVDAGDGGRARRVRFVMDAGLIKDTYELEYTWAADGLRVLWELVDGTIQKAQHGSYVLTPIVGGDDPATEVTYSLAVELTIPLIGAIRRKAERTIMDTALTQLRRRVERAD